MSALNLGTLNIRPDTKYEVYRNASRDAVTVTLTLADLQTAFTVHYGSATTTLEHSGAVTVNVPASSSITLSHGDANVMQPVKVQLAVA